MDGPRRVIKALSSEQEEAIKNLIREENRRVRNTQGRGREGAVDHEEFPAPEVYMVLAPHGGIPPVTVGQFETGTGTGTGTGTTFGDDVPGSAICQIYQQVKTDDASVSGTLKPIPGEVKRVYNANRTKVQAGSWVLVARDKFETWWVANFSIGGTATSTICDEITVVSNVCLAYIPGTATSGPVDAVIVEYSTYNLRTCELVDRWCIRNPLACCVVCNGFYYPQRIFCTVTQTTGTGCLCADGLELTLNYKGLVTSGSETGSHWWGTAHVPFGTCLMTVGGTTPQSYVTLDLYLRPSGCTLVQNLLISNQNKTTNCHNNLSGIIILSLDPFHVQGIKSGAFTVSCSPGCVVSTGDELIFDYTA